ncbi:MAG: hypothetical protein RL701_2828 [Pseudomonadota bacterium]|jgi:hypothetical protein
MTDKRSPLPDGWEDLGAQWRSRARERAEPTITTTSAVDITEARSRARAFARKVFLRNAREACAAGLVIAVGVRSAWIAATTLAFLGGVSLALGALFILVVLLVRGRNRSAPPSDAPTSVVLAHERHELDKQARLLERVWLWYLAPLVPGAGCMSLDSLLGAVAKAAPLGIVLEIANSAFVLAVFVFVAWLNQRAARKLRERMANL